MHPHEQPSLPPTEQPPVDDDPWNFGRGEPTAESAELSPSTPPIPPDFSWGDGPARSPWELATTSDGSPPVIGQTALRREIVKPPTPEEEARIIAENIALVSETLAAKGMEALPDDEFKVSYPLKHPGRYDPDDVRLIAGTGKEVYFTRADLQKAGVFFVNRVGAGEQPIFGVPIPDPESEGGIFHVQNRSFLTKEEFEKVYNYQQRNGYGISSLDPASVQKDMLVFTANTEGRLGNVIKYSSSGGRRENKYGLVRSPFVDLPFYVRAGISSSYRETGEDGKSRMTRINTTVLHLANGHPGYPGVSEMFDPETVAPDQRYMSPGEFVRKFYRVPEATGN